MGREFLEIIFLCGVVFQAHLRTYYVQYYNSARKENFFTKKEKIFLGLVFIGFYLLPIFYIFTTWFAAIDYTLPKWTGFPATALFVFGIWLFFRSHADLGKYWSPGLELKEDHQLVKTGVFTHIRHPMYASFIAIAIAQVFMLQNWLVGPSFLLSALPLYLNRVNREEKQLISRFGAEYRDYMKETGRIFPREEIVKEFIYSRLPEKIREKVKGQ